MFALLHVEDDSYVNVIVTVDGLDARAHLVAALSKAVERRTMAGVGELLRQAGLQPFKYPVTLLPQLCILPEPLELDVLVEHPKSTLYRHGFLQQRDSLREGATKLGSQEDGRVVL